MAEYWYGSERGGLQAQRAKFWWREPKDTIHEALFAQIKTLQNAQRYRQQANLHHVRLYGDSEIMGLDADQYARSETYEEHATYNVIEQMIDTLHADITGDRARIMFLTDGGTMDKKEQAKKLGRYIDGEFYRCGVHTEVAPDVALDAQVLGTGFARTYRCHHTNRPKVKRVFADKVIVDDAEAHDRDPRQLFILDEVPRESVIGAWAQGDSALVEKLKLTPEAKKVGGTPNTVSDMVYIAEAWHLPNRPLDPDATDKDVIAAGGVHIIAVENHPLMIRPWRRQRFPVSTLRYKRRNQGWWGKGIAEILDGRQVAINEMLWKMHMTLKLAGPKIFVAPGSEMNTAHLTNEIWGIIETNVPPHVVVFEGIPPELFRMLQTEIQAAADLVGVNAISSGSDLPPGLQGGSGRAIRLYTDSKSKRHIKFRQAYDQWHVDVSECLIAENKELEKEGTTYEVMAPMPEQGTAERIKWKDVSFGDQETMMLPYPTNFLSNTPQGRVRDLEDLFNVAPQLRPMALELLDYPDIRAAQNTITSSQELIRQICENILYKGETYGPDPHLPMEATLATARNMYLLGIKDKAPEANLEKLRAFMVAVEKMHREAQAAAAPAPGALPPAPPQPGPGPAAPPGAPGPQVPPAGGGGGLPQ